MATRTSARVLRYGLADDADVRATDVTVDETGAASFTVTAPFGTDPQDLITVVEQTGYTATLPAAEPPSSEEEAPQDRELTALRQRLIGSAVLAVPVILLAMVPALQFDYWGFASLVLATPVVFWAGWPFHRATWTNLRHGAATMDTLISVGTLSAWLWSVVALFFGTAGDRGMTHAFELTISRSDGLGSIYLEVAAGVTAFVLAGRYAEARARRRSGAALDALMDLAATEASVLRDGREVRLPVNRVVVGDRFVVRPGEKIATDGAVVSGTSAVGISHQPSRV